MLKVAALAALAVVTQINFSLFQFQSGYAGPCDIAGVTCAEAYSVTRSMKASYGGPLFQLYNGASTLDVGQVNHVVDMTTWSAFCSGVASNCVVGKIYAQINGSPNDLRPAVFVAPNGPNCSGGTIYKCAAPFSIEAATGKPIVITTTAQEYALVSDNAATGVTGGRNATSIFYNGLSVQSLYCCGVFGIAHPYTVGNTPGTDFLIYLLYGNANDFSNCSTSTAYCVGIEEESFGDTVDYGGTSAYSALITITYDGTNTVTTNVNGNALFSRNPPASGSGTLNPGKSIHLGGGGDLSQPAPAKMREGFITNSVIDSTVAGLIVANSRAFYNTLTFP